METQLSISGIGMAQAKLLLVGNSMFTAVGELQRIEQSGILHTYALVISFDRAGQALPQLSIVADEAAVNPFNGGCLVVYGLFSSG